MHPSDGNFVCELMFLLWNSGMGVRTEPHGLAFDECHERQMPMGMRTLLSFRTAG